MKQKIIIIFLLLSSFPSFSQLLWSIEKKGLKKTSYLYGTIHEGDSSVISWDEDFMELFYSCEMFMGEMDLTQTEQLNNAMNYLTQEGKRDPNEVISKTLADSISLIEQKIAEELDEETAKQLLTVKPILSAIQLSVLRKIKNGNAISEPSIENQTKPNSVRPDFVLTEYAQNAGINVRGLETPEDQINALFKIPLHIQWKALYDDVMHQDTTIHQQKDILEDLTKAYKKQDINQLNQFINDQEMPKEMARELIIVRNYHMLAGIEEVLLDEESIFFAVGAGHLGGKEGLIELLKSRGYQVKPVYFKWTQK